MIAGSAFMALYMFFIIIGIALLVFEVFMFIDAIKNPKLSDTEKVLWCLGMLFIHPFIAIIYYFVARSALDKPAN